MIRDGLPTIRDGLPTIRHALLTIPHGLARFSVPDDDSLGSPGVPPIGVGALPGHVSYELAR
jgi:hypothetical protein